MKKIFCILFTLMAVCAGAQSTSTDLVPDYTWADDNHRDWCDKGIGTAFLAYNGYLHVFNYQGNGTRKGGHAYMYQINEHCTKPCFFLAIIKVGRSRTLTTASNSNFPTRCILRPGSISQAFTFTDADGMVFLHIGRPTRENMIPIRQTKAMSVTPNCPLMSTKSVLHTTTPQSRYPLY